MGWYDFFSRFYDSSLEALYADARNEAAKALELEVASKVLDIPTGTGQSLDVINNSLPPASRILAVDLSKGMLDKARQRARKGGYANRVDFIHADAAKLDCEPSVDRLHVFLGLTAMADYDGTFSHLWRLLKPGGRAVVVDVHAEHLGLRGHTVNWVARADIRRRTWEPLERLSVDFCRTALPQNPRYGGTLWLATGRKPWS